MEGFSEELREKMDEYVHLIYRVTRDFPKEELYGIISQLRRAALSVVLNYIEGFARRKTAVKLHFWEVAYASLQESKYLLEFSLEENYLTQSDYKGAFNLAEEIGAMLWRSMKPLKYD